MISERIESFLCVSEFILNKEIIDSVLCNIFHFDNLLVEKAIKNKLFLKQIYIKLFEINHFFLKDIKEIKEKRTLYLPFFLNKKVISIKNDLDKLLFKHNSLIKNSDFIFYFFHSKNNNISKVPELKNLSFLSSIYLSKNQKTYKNFFFYLKKIFRNEKLQLENKNEKVFLSIFCFFILEIFYKEVGFSSSSDPYGMKKILPSIIKNFEDINLFSFINDFYHIKHIFYKKLESKYKVDNLENIILSRNISSILELDKFISLRKYILSYKEEIKRVRNFCRNMSFTSCNLDNFFKLEEMKHFLNINDYLENFEKKTFPSKEINFIFDNIYINKNPYKNEKTYVIYKLFLFLDGLL